MEIFLILDLSLRDNFYFSLKNLFEVYLEFDDNIQYDLSFVRLYVDFHFMRIETAISEGISCLLCEITTKHNNYFARIVICKAAIYEDLL